MIELFDFQRADVKRLLDNDATGFVVAETGAGKTVIGAATAYQTGVATKLIIAPAGTHKKVWKHTIEQIDPRAIVQQISGTEPGKQAMDDLEWKKPGYYLMTPQLFTKWKPLHLRPDLVLVDEAHLLGNRDSTGGKALRKLQAGHKIPMSGTMWRNKFENAWNLLRWVYDRRNGAGDIADVAPNRWITNYCETEYDHFAPGQRRVVGELVPGRIAELVPCWIQHFKREACCEFHPEGFLHNLPAPIVIPEVVEMTAVQKKMIKQMEDEYVSYLEIQAKEIVELSEQGIKRALTVKIPLVQQIRISQMTLGEPSFYDTGKVDEDGAPKYKIGFAPDAPSPKLDRYFEIMEKVNEPTVAATNSLEFAGEAVRRINASGRRAFEWSSRSTQKERDQALVDFERGDYDAVVGVTEAIATGIDGLQDASGVLVSLNKSRDITTETQLEGRLDRRGQRRTEGVLHYEVIAAGSSDEGIISSQLKRRLALNKTLRRELRKKEAEQNEDHH